MMHLVHSGASHVGNKFATTMKYAVMQELIKQAMIWKRSLPVMIIWHC